MGNPKPPHRGTQRGPAANSTSSRASALRNEAQQLLAEGKRVPALEALNRLIDLGAAGVSDWLLAGNTLLSLREHAQAVAVFEEALKLEPENEEGRFNLAAALFQLGDVTAAAEHFEWVARRYGNLKAWLSLATIIPGCPQSSHKRVLDIRRAFASALEAMSQIPLNYSFPPRSDARIRVGYISAYFHRSNYMKPVWGLVNGHDRERFEICLLADDTADEGLGWFAAGPHDRVHLTRDLDNRQLIDLIRQQQLDILVDLNGYSVPSRLEILLSRLAPVCIAWFNMYATSGLPGIDWIVGDELVIRPSEEPLYSERVKRLPQSYLSFVVGHESPDVSPPPCSLGQPFTFGSLVSQYKITPAVLDAWSEILRRAAATRLILANRTLGSTCNRDYLYNQFQQRGIGRERLTVLPPAPHIEFLRYYDQIDLALDSFPYNGGTTTTEAIWQGVPVLAMDGDRWAARTSKTLLLNGYLGEFVAAGVQEYVDSAVRWGTDPDSAARLAELRQSMRASLLGSPVCRVSSMVEAMEQFYIELMRNRP